MGEESKDQCDEGHEVWGATEELVEARPHGPSSDHPQSLQRVPHYSLRHAPPNCWVPSSRLSGWEHSEKLLQGQGREVTRVLKR